MRGRETAAPRSITGFLYLLYSTLMAGSVITVGLLIGTARSGLVGFVLLFAALITVALGVAVVTIAWKDGSRLMLGPVTAREYAAIRYIKMGDDASGERVERLLSGGPVEDLLLETSTPTALELLDGVIEEET